MPSVPSRLAEPSVTRPNAPRRLPRTEVDTISSDFAQRIYVLGTGGVGKFLAHAICSAPEAPPISLLFHRPSLITSLRTPQCHLCMTSDKVSTRAGPFDVELVLPERLPLPLNSVRTPAHFDRERVERAHARFVNEAHIKQLVVTVKAHQTVAALTPLRHRLGSESTILFCQNGMGIVDEVCEALWPEEDGRPTMMLGVNSHGVHGTGPFTVDHAGHGVLYLGVLPRDGSVTGSSTSSHTTNLHGRRGSSNKTGTYSLPARISKVADATPAPTPLIPSTRSLLRTLTRIPLLAATAVPPKTLHQRALEKVAVNAIINPLTTLLDARNGSLLQNHALSRCFRLLLLEISSVYRSLPELISIPNLNITFSPERLEQMVVSVAGRTADNISSMLQDVRRGSKTEIDYLNGYVVRRGEENGVRPVMNYLVMNMVKGKQGMVSKEADAYAPFGPKL